jgi:hypothetical protein
MQKQVLHLVWGQRDAKACQHRVRLAHLLGGEVADAHCPNLAGLYRIDHEMRRI